MRTLDLFSGIGGFALASHWMGWETAAFVEWDSFCQKVLNKNFPNTPIYGDITQFSYESECDRIGPIDLICGGFPCQPFSHAGKRAGRNDERHLWPEMLRIIRESQPSFVVGENVAGLISMDGGDVLESICLDLEGEGYAVQPFIVPALSVGAPHRRDRIWIVANCQGAKRQQSGSTWSGWERFTDSFGASLTNTTSQQEHPATTGGFQPEFGGGLGYAQSARATEIRGTRQGPNTYGIGSDWRSHWHEVAAELCRMDDGLSSELDKLTNSDRTKRLKALGNAIVPQVAYEIFRAINEIQKNHA